MDTDFNTAQALGAIFSLVSEVNKAFNTLDEMAEPVLAEAYQALTETCQVLGIYNVETQDETGDNVEQRDELVKLLLEIRQGRTQPKGLGNIR